jgi:hypothetical protein
MIGLALGGIAALSGLGALFGWKKAKDEEEKVKAPQPARGTVVTQAASTMPSVGPAPAVDKIALLKNIVLRLLAQAPVTDAERANAVNTAIAAGLPALAAALRSGSLIDIAKAAAGL